MQSAPSLWGAKALTGQAPQTQQVRPWQSASKPQGGLNNKCNKGFLSIATILIFLWKLLPQGHQSPQRVHDERKLHRFSNQCRSQGLYTQCNDGNYHHCQHGQCKQHKLCNKGGHSRQAQQQEESPECKDKCFKPWCLHDEHANHSYDECRTNLHNQACKQQQLASSNNNNKVQLQWHVHHASCTQRLLDK